MARPELRPAVGFCIQTDSLGTPAGRWYLNMTRHSIVEMPVAHSGKTIDKEFILTHGIGSMKIPFDMGSFRKLKERADGAKHTAYCVDVVFNPFIIQMFMDDVFNQTMAEYRPFIINLALQRIEQAIGVKLSTHKVKLVKKFLYKDGEGSNGDIPRDFTELPDEMEATDEMMPPKKPPPSEEPAEALIQDVTPGMRKKQAMKKGFFNNAKESLYPAEGSKEGVVPENAGDPLGYLPKKLRQSCKVVDTNAPEYQESERKKKAAEDHNAQNKEFSDMLQSDLSKYSKMSSQWDQDDRPDGVDDAPTIKYDNDYSRFDKIDDVVEKPEVAQRDWYSDGKGNVRYHSSAASAAAIPGGKASDPAVKKGFLDTAKSPLYPKGSQEGRKEDPAATADLLKNLGNEYEKAFGSELGSEYENIFGDLEKLPQPHSQSLKAQKPKAAEVKTATYTLERDDAEGLFQLAVSVPGLTSMQGVELDVTEKLASLAFPSSVGFEALKVELDAAVIPTGVRAKFSKKTSQIMVKLPLVLKVAKAG